MLLLWGSDPAAVAEAPPSSGQSDVAPQPQPAAPTDTSGKPATTEKQLPSPARQDANAPATPTPADASKANGQASSPGQDASAAQPEAVALAADPPPGGFSGDSNITTEPQDTKPDKAAYNGSFTKVVDLKVPAFRGIEPDIDLAYDSSLGLRAGGLFAGYVGVGWQVSGISDIVRISARQGAPAFDANDTFALDGTPLVACAAAASNPGCTAGGTHATRVESYRRVAFASADNSWTVTGRDGTRSVYRPVSTWGSSVPSGDTDPDKLRNQYRWLLAEVIDTHGNTVSYGYSCGVLPSCWPNQITYAGVQIDFIADTVADTQIYATGRSLAVFDRRLRRIEIRVDGQKHKAYVLTQQASPITGLARLTSVREFGSDFVVQPDGSVTGTALPPTTFAYSNPDMSLTSRRVSLEQRDRRKQFGVGDFNGDGMAQVSSPGSRLHIDPPNRYCTFGGGIAATGTCPLVDQSVSTWVGDNVVLDFNGDGLDDFLWTQASCTPTGNCNTASGAAYSFRIDPTLPAPNNLVISGAGLPLPYRTSTGAPVTSYQTVGDFNGDGREDLFVSSKAFTSGGSLRIFWSTGPSPALGSTSATVGAPLQ